MKLYFNSRVSEQEIIRKAYDFEIEAIEKGSSERNPYKEILDEMGLWEALNEAIELAYN